MTVSQSRANHFAREESLRCELLRHMARRASRSRDSNTSKDPSSEDVPEELKENVHQPVQPVRLVQPSVILEVEPPWQYPDRAWRKHPMVMKYSDEVLVFIPTASYPAHADAAFSLIAWLRQPGKLNRPLTKSLHSGVVRVEGMGWIVTFGDIPGALDRMLSLLEWKAGQTLIFKGKRYTIEMHTHVPLEWML